VFPGKLSPLVLSLVFTLLLFSCCPSMKTDKTSMPKAAAPGSLSITIKPGEGITKSDVSRLKELLALSFSEAGYNRISFNGSKESRRKLDMVVTKFEHAAPSNNTETAVGVGCAYVCFLLAPCLLVPGYNSPEFELRAEVTGYAGGSEVFSKAISERAVASSNAFDRGSEEFKKQLEALTVNNLVAKIVTAMDGK
jgi:hypothetical protein